MTAGVFSALLFAAILNATWNVLVKVSADRLVMFAVIKFGTTVFALLALPFIELPSPDLWPYIAASVVIHTAYFLFLAMAYRYGDLSSVYPISRGAAPLIVAIFAIVFLGERLGSQATFGLIVISCGIMSLVLTKNAAGSLHRIAIGAALATGCMIAGYTVVDGMGVRISGCPFSYLVWINLLNGLPIIAIALLLRRNEIGTQVESIWKIGFVSSIVSLLAYSIALWASTQAPLAVVAAIRESSVIFAVPFGVIFLKEKLDIRRFGSVFMTLLGTILLKSSR